MTVPRPRAHWNVRAGARAGGGRVGRVFGHGTLYLNDLGLQDMPEEQRNRCFLLVNQRGDGRVSFEEFH